MRTSLRFLILGAVAAMLAACGASNSIAPSDGTPDPPTPPPEEQPVDGRYAVQSVSGSALPALINQSVDTSTHEVIDTYLTSDTLEVTGEGRYVQRARLEARIGGRLVDRRQWADHGRLSRDAESLAFTSDYFQNVSFSGVVQDSSAVLVQQDLAGEGHVVEYVFRRLP
ncbi:MAG TPA: hypothetical protein VFK04_05075 [Gemmatimonadaceae bacterium]|nr:hypothetical protein [Gemmatimonadaceae bacterium]